MKVSKEDVEFRRKAAAFQQKLYDDLNFVSLQGILVNDEIVDVYARRVGGARFLGTVLDLLNDNNVSKAETLNRIARFYFDAGMLFVLENPEAKELVVPTKKLVKRNMVDWVEELVKQKEFDDQK